jgi:hypothetical protein
MSFKNAMGACQVDKCELLLLTEDVAKFVPISGCHKMIQDWLRSKKKYQ